MHIQNEDPGAPGAAARRQAPFDVDEVADRVVAPIVHHILF